MSHDGGDDRDCGGLHLIETLREDRGRCQILIVPLKRRPVSHELSRHFADFVFASREHADIDAVVRLDAGIRCAKCLRNAVVANPAGSQNLECEASLCGLPAMTLYIRSGRSGCRPRQAFQATGRSRTASIRRRFASGCKRIRHKNRCPIPALRPAQSPQACGYPRPQHSQVPSPFAPFPLVFHGAITECGINLLAPPLQRQRPQILDQRGRIVVRRDLNDQVHLAAFGLKAGKILGRALHVHPVDALIPKAFARCITSQTRSCVYHSRIAPLKLLL